MNKYDIQNKAPRTEEKHLSLLLCYYYRTAEKRGRPSLRLDVWRWRLVN